MFIAGKHLPGAASTCLRADMQVRTVVKPQIEANFCIFIII